MGSRAGRSKAGRSKAGGVAANERRLFPGQEVARLVKAIRATDPPDHDLFDQLLSLLDGLIRHYAATTVAWVSLQIGWQVRLWMIEEIEQEIRLALWRAVALGSLRDGGLDPAWVSYPSSAFYYLAHHTISTYMCKAGYWAHWGAQTSERGVAIPFSWIVPSGSKSQDETQAHSWHPVSTREDPDRLVETGRGAIHPLDLHTALLSLPLYQARALVLTYYLGLTEAVVCCYLNCNLSQLRGLKAQGLTTLRGLLTASQ
jgi:DNA-directed RNA polymerase specialized sigma24 family protein